MLGSLLGLIFALVVVYFKAVIPNWPIWASFLIASVTLIFFFLYILNCALAYNPIQRAEHTLTSRIAELYRQDRLIKTISLAMIVYFLTSLFFLYELNFLRGWEPAYSFAGWIFITGVAIDGFSLFLHRTLAFLSPFEAVKLLSAKAKQCIRNNKNLELYDWIDALTQTADKALKSSNLAICNLVLDELQAITKTFFESSKDVSHLQPNTETERLGIQDQVSYTVFFILQRLEFLNHLACEKKYELICSALITNLGKIIVNAAKLDLTLTAYPIHFLGRAAKEAQRQEMPEIAVKAVLTLVEVGRSILEEVDISYLEIKDPFLSIINNLEEITKEIFRKNKAIEIQLLTHPFNELKALFTQDKLAKHQDTALILQNIDRVLAEFASLELVMKTMPPMPADLTGLAGDENQPSTTP